MHTNFVAPFRAVKLKQAKTKSPKAQLCNLDPEPYVDCWASWGSDVLGIAASRTVCERFQRWGWPCAVYQVLTAHIEFRVQTLSQNSHYKNYFRRLCSPCWCRQAKHGKAQLQHFLEERLGLFLRALGFLVN